MNSPVSKIAKRVLLVEDDAPLAETITLLLEAFGYIVCGTISSGEEAVAEVPTLAPDIILMDINLEGILDGIEAGAIISATSTAPFIFMTANHDMETRERAGVFPNSGYLVKPFYPEALPNMIEARLRNAET